MRRQYPEPVVLKYPRTIRLLLLIDLGLAAWLVLTNLL